MSIDLLIANISCSPFRERFSSGTESAERALRCRPRNYHGRVQWGLSDQAILADLLGLFVRDAAPTASVWLVGVASRVLLGRLAPHALRRLEVR